MRVRLGRDVAAVLCAVGAASTLSAGVAQAGWERLPDPLAAEHVAGLTGGEVEDLNLAVAPSGLAVSVWGYAYSGGDGVEGAVWSAVRRGDAPFAAPQMLRRNTFPLFPPAIATSSRGEAWAMWRDDSGTWGARLPPNRPFGRAAPVRPRNEYEVFGLGYDARGRLYALVLDGAVPGFSWTILTRTGGGRFTARRMPRAVQRSSILVEIGAPLAIAASGEWTFLVEYGDRWRPWLGVRRRAPDGAVGAAQPLQRFSCRADDEGRRACTLESSDVAVSARGDAVAAWCVRVRGRRLVRVSQRRGRARFGPSRTFPVRGRDCEAKVTMAANGEGLVTWTSADAVHAVRRTPGGRLGRAHAIGRTTGSAQAAVSRRGDAVVVTEQPRGTLRASVRAPHRGFAPPQVVAADVEAAADFRLGIDAAGRALLLYPARPQRGVANQTLRALAYEP